MKKKRYLTDDELNRIRIEEDMLKGNINRMCVCDECEELITMYRFSKLRIQTIFDICSEKFIESENK